MHAILCKDQCTVNGHCNSLSMVSLTDLTHITSTEYSVIVHFMHGWPWIAACVTFLLMHGILCKGPYMGTATLLCTSVNVGHD